ncbi:hypothetical protein NBZ79_05160 [Sneathiella marina]|uniref:Uncharacterized protein n=1 Tax=Sneathiella marina TaxID=2950108 RepID=A0ABY4W598_9PROT|nr:hypothetical protein [Sneathiella marina]USG62368.1 hypothetical protein NBZ79_05160 [Sneathiella marina]
MNDTTQSGAAGAPTAAGGLVIPDLSALSALQKQNMQKMTAAVETASHGLQDIVSQQRSTLQETAENLQASLSTARPSDQSGIVSFPDIQSQISNLSTTIENMNSVATTLTASTTKSFDTVTQSLTEALAAIEDVAQKFSSGG